MRRSEKAIFILLLGMLLFLGFNRHSKDSHVGYHSVLWADASGYHIYLPMLFDSKRIHDLLEDEELGLLAKIGYGFEFSENNIYSKYPIGVSILQSPVYIVIRVFNDDAKPFSKIYQLGILSIGILYGWLGLLLVYLTLIKLRVRKMLAWTAIICLTFGTNSYYYIIDSPGFSHVYSFFAVSALMYSWLLFLEHKRTRDVVWISIIVGLIFLIRPMNSLWILPMLLALGMLQNDMDEFITSVSAFFRSAYWLIFSIPLIMAFIQIMVWSEMASDLTFYSYQNEGFSNWKSPKVMEVLFSPNNGMMLYTPFWSIIFLGFIYNWKIFKVTFIPMITFVSVILIYSAWWNWQLGCSFGYRGVVELLPFFVVVFTLILNEKYTKQVRVIGTAVVILLIVWNLKLTYTFDECWLYGDWDYREFFEGLVLAKTR